MALIVIACGGQTASTPLTGASAPPPAASLPPSNGPALPTVAPVSKGPLPAPALRSIDEIVAALSDPAQADQVVVSMLDLLGIGLYEPDGTRIRAGTERTDDDFYVSEPAARGLAAMLRDGTNPAELLSFRDLYAGVVGLGFTGTADDLATAYADAYAAEPGAPISRLLATYGAVDVAADLPPFAAWLLILDGFIPPNAATTAVALAGVGAGPIAAGGQTWGTARSRVQARSTGAQGNLARYIARLMAISRTWVVIVNADAKPVHEGHGTPGPTVPFVAFPDASSTTFISPMTGNPVIPVDPGGAGISGIHVAWKPDAAASRHGAFSVASSAVDATNATGTYATKQEEANSHDVVFIRDEPACIEATVSRAELLTRLYGVTVGVYAPLVRGDVSGQACLEVEWHEKVAVKVTIVWTETFDGIADTVTFSGDLTQIQPNCSAIPPPTGPCSIDGSLAYMGEGTATGSRPAWKACNPGIYEVPEGSGPATFTGTVNGGTISIGAYANYGTPLAGVITAVFTVSLDGGQATFGPPPPIGPLPSRDPEEATQEPNHLCPHSAYGTISVIGLQLPRP